MSKGAEELLKIIKIIFPNQRIVTEYHIGERLLLDIYIPALAIALEFDGIQHEVFNPFFYKSREHFAQAKRRDLRKDELCEESGIILIRVSYNDPVEVDFVKEKISEALDN